MRRKWLALALAAATSAGGCAAQRMDAPALTSLAEVSAVQPEEALEDGAATPAAPRKDCQVINGIAICR